MDTFVEFVGTTSFQLGDIENVYMHLFPFSLAGKEKHDSNHIQVRASLAGRIQRKKNYKYFSNISLHQGKV